MNLKDLDDFIVFDKLPAKYISQQKIILTHLLNLEKQVLPERLGTIITTEHLGQQFKEYCKQKGAKCLDTLNFSYIQTYQCEEFVVGTRHKLQMLFCESKEATRNLMVLIREAGKLKCIYSGNFLDIRNAVFNDTFASWLEHDTVPRLYFNLKRCRESPHKQDVDLIFKVFDFVEEILKCHSNRIIHMYLPPFGYDNFIAILAVRFPKRITISSDLKTYTDHNIEDKTLKLLCDTIEKSKIILFPGKPQASTQDDICTFTKRQQVIIYIQQTFKNIEKMQVTTELTYYELYYTPEHSPFQLQSLCLILKPKRLQGIVDSFNTVSKVPQYLSDLCGVTTAKKPNNNSLRTLTVKERIVYGPKRENISPQRRGIIYMDDDSKSD